MFREIDRFFPCELPLSDYHIGVWWSSGTFMWVCVSDARRKRIRPAVRSWRFYEDIRRLHQKWHAFTYWCISSNLLHSLAQEGHSVESGRVWRSRRNQRNLQSHWECFCIVIWTLLMRLGDTYSLIREFHPTCDAHFRVMENSIRSWILTSPKEKE